MKLYAMNFGYYWRLTPAQLRKCCEDILSGKGFDLDAMGAKSIKHKPRHGEGVFVFNMLDWKDDQATTTLQELDKPGTDYFSCSRWIWGT